MKDDLPRDVLSDNSFSEDNVFDEEWKPQGMNYDTFHLRNDPTSLLKEIKFYLMQVEEVGEKNNPNKKVLIRKKDPFTGKEVRPIVNQQGVEEIMMALRPIINNHNVMGNTSSENFHIKRMNFISGDLTVLFWSKRDKWNLDRDNVNGLIQFLSHQIDIFLTRTIGDAERKHYGESFKETREVKPMVSEKKHFLSNLIPSAFKR